MVESAPHGTAHVGIGGLTGDMSVMMSPCDPLFYSLHAYMDKVWDRWQRSGPGRFTSYLGTNRNGTPARLTDRLVSYTSWTVGSTLDVSASPMCVAYSDDSMLHPASLTTLLNGTPLRKRAEIKLEDLEPLGTPEPLPDSYITMMNLNRTIVRGVETTLKTFIHKCNEKIELVKTAIEESIDAMNNGSMATVAKLQQEIGNAVNLKDLVRQATDGLADSEDDDLPVDDKPLSLVDRCIERASRKSEHLWHKQKQQMKHDNAVEAE
jgi:hypothetical protein